MFRTMYDRKQLKPVKACPGSGTKIEYQLRIKGSVEVLEPVGKSSLYDYIQSHSDSVDIHKILERCALMDDYSILNRMPAQFMDVTEMPTNLAEAYSMVEDAKKMFERMPTSVKESYDNNFVEFIQDIGSDKFVKIVGEFVKYVKDPDKEEFDIKKEVNKDVKES